MCDLSMLSSLALPFCQLTPSLCNPILIWYISSMAIWQFYYLHWLDYEVAYMQTFCDNCLHFISYIVWSIILLSCMHWSFNKLLPCVALFLLPCMHWSFQQTSSMCSFIPCNNNFNKQPMHATTLWVTTILSFNATRFTTIYKILHRSITNRSNFLHLSCSPTHLLSLSLSHTYQFVFSLSQPTSP
jgi:hypothetical protein